MADTLAILVGGGPAPGINGVIASATIEAINAGLRVVGIYDGYRDLAAGTPVKTTALSIDDAARIQSSGGSFLRTSRTNPAKDAATLDRTIHSLETLGVRYLICIGGDDTTFGAAQHRRENQRHSSASQPSQKRSTTIYRSPTMRRLSASKRRARSARRSSRACSKMRAPRCVGMSSSAWDASRVRLHSAWPMPPVRRFGHSRRVPRRYARP